MEYLTTIIAIGLASFLLFFFSSQLEEKHGILKLLTLFFVLALIILLPKAAIDAQTTCDIVLNNTHTNPNATGHGYGTHTDTIYEYSTYCFTQESATNLTFLKGIMWFFGIFVMYVIIYLGYVALEVLKNWLNLRGRK